MPATLIPTEDVKFAIHQMIAIDGINFRNTATAFQITEAECRKLYREADAEAAKQFANKAGHIREINDQIYQRIIGDAKQAWDESRASKKIKKWRETTDNSATESSSKVMEEITTEERVGDPKFLAIQLQAADLRSKLHGAEAPKRLEVETKTTLDVYIEVSALSREERDREAELYRMRQAGLIVIEQEPQPEKKRR